MNTIAPFASLLTGLAIIATAAIVFSVATNFFRLRQIERNSRLKIKQRHLDAPPKPRCSCPDCAAQTAAFGPNWRN